MTIMSFVVSYSVYVSCRVWCPLWESIRKELQTENKDKYMTHQGIEWKAMGGKLPPWCDGSMLLGDGPYYCAGANSLLVGTLVGNEVKWKAPPFPVEPPPRVGCTAWYQKVEGRPFVFVFGGTIPDIGNTPAAPANP